MKYAHEINDKMPPDQIISYLDRFEHVTNAQMNQCHPQLSDHVIHLSNSD